MVIIDSSLAPCSVVGSVTKRLLCISGESTDECKTRGEEQWHCPSRGEAAAHTHHPFHAKMNARAPSKRCLLATFLLRFQHWLYPMSPYVGSDTPGVRAPYL